MENQNIEAAGNTQNNTQILTNSVKTHIGDLTFQILDAQNTIERQNQTISELQNQLNEALSNAKV
jgi:hypothetical protein